MVEVEEKNGVALLWLATLPPPISLALVITFDAHRSSGAAFRVGGGRVVRLALADGVWLSTSTTSTREGAYSHKLKTASTCKLVEGLEVSKYCR